MNPKTPTASDALPRKWLHPLLHWGLALSLTLCTAAVQAQAQAEPVVTKRVTELRDGPGLAARTVAQLPAQTAVTRLTERSGPWIQVQVRPAGAGQPPGATGWVHMFDLGLPASTSSGNNAASGALRGITNFLNRGSSGQGSTVATSTIGIRGLGADDLARSQPNILAVNQMETLRIDADRARQFARVASLSAYTVAALPAGSPSAFSGPSSGSPSRPAPNNAAGGRDMSQ